MAGIAGAELHHLGLAKVAQVLEQRPAPLVTGKLRRHDLRPRGDVGEQVVADERLSAVVVDEQRVRRRVPGSEDDAQRAAAGLDEIPVTQHAVGGEVGALANDVLEEGGRLLYQLGRERHGRASAPR